MSTLSQVDLRLKGAEAQLLAAAVYVPALTPEILSSVHPDELADEDLQEALVIANRLFEERDGLGYGMLLGAGAPETALSAIRAVKADVMAPFAPDPVRGFLGARAVKRIHRLLSGSREELATLGLVDADELLGLAAGLDIAIREEAGKVGESVPPALILDLMRSAYDERKDGAAATYGIRAFDSHTGGLRRGTLHVLGGPSGGGKSAMALTAAVATAKAGERVLYVTKEMNSRECAFRMAAMLSGKTEAEIRDQPWAETEADIRGRVPTNFVFADDLRTVNDVKSTVHRAAVMGEPYGLVVVDYLQQYRIRRASNSNPVEEIDEAVEILKGLAMARDCAILTPAQLNRSVDSGALANTEHLRGSGGIEQWADAVVMLRGTDQLRTWDHSAVVGSAPANYRIMEAAVRKARNGQIAVLWDSESDSSAEPLKFGLGTFRFWDAKWDPWGYHKGTTAERDIAETGSHASAVPMGDDELERYSANQ